VAADARLFPAPGSGSRRAGGSPWRRVAWVAAGFVLALLLAEATLQVLRVALGAGCVPDARPTAHPGRIALLCIGDSHTYGLGVQRELQSYPVRLEVLLNGGDRAGPFVVENAGTPGNNTALTAWQLRRALARGHYDAVLVLAGFNDEWNLTEPPAGGGAPPRAKLLLPQLARWILFCLRPPLVAADRVERDEQGLLIRGPDGERQPVNADPSSRPGLFTGAALAQKVETGLVAMVRECKAAGVPVVLETYASRANDRFLMASAGARVAAQKERVALVDQAQWFDEKAHDVDAKILFQPDGHPTGTGCDLMARAVLAKLLELHERGDAPFAAWPIAKPPAVAPATSSAVDAASLALELSPSGEKGVVRFDLRGPPGVAFHVALARSRAAGGGAASGLALALDPLLTASLAADGLSGSFGADGRAQAWVGSDLFADPPQPKACAQLLAIDPYAADPRRALRGASSVVEIAWPAK
jgi:lysophospholipase L1-like esterase